MKPGGTGRAFDADWLRAVRSVVEVIREQQAGSDEEDARPGGPVYTFLRDTPFATDTLILRGRGQPAKRCGMSKSHFRPSDDASHLRFPIPANAMAAVGLKEVATIIRSLELDPDLARTCE